MARRRHTAGVAAKRAALKVLAAARKAVAKIKVAARVARRKRRRA